MISTLLYLTASRPDLQFAICMCARPMRIMLVVKIHAVAHSGSMQFMGDRLVSWSSKRQKSAAIYCYVRMLCSNSLDEIIAYRLWP
ncbi:hypothetical protein Tco_0120511 [Tanacetum coccineum]